MRKKEREYGVLHRRDGLQSLARLPAVIDDDDSYCWRRRDEKRFYLNSGPSKSRAVLIGEFYSPEVGKRSKNRESEAKGNPTTTSFQPGHKEECRPPSTTIQFDGEQIDSGREEMFQEQFEIYGNVFEIEGRCCTKPIETFPEELSESSHFPEVPWGKDDDKVEPLVDAEGTTTIYESSGTSSLGGFSASTNTSESSGDVSFCEVLSSSTPDISEGHPSDMLKNMADVNEMELTKSPLSEFVDGEVHCRSSSSCSSINSSDEYSFAEPSTASSDFSEATLDSGPEVFMMNLLCPISVKLDQTLIPDDCHPTGLESKMLTDGAAFSEKVDTNAFNVRSSPYLRSERSESLANDRSNVSLLLKSREIRSLSSSASDNHPSSSVKSAKQFRFSKLSKHYPLGLGSEIAVDHVVLFLEFIISFPGTCDILCVLVLTDALSIQTVHQTLQLEQGGTAPMWTHKLWEQGEKVAEANPSTQLRSDDERPPFSEGVVGVGDDYVSGSFRRGEGIEYTTTSSQWEGVEYATTSVPQREGVEYATTSFPQEERVEDATTSFPQREGVDSILIISDTLLEHDSVKVKECGITLPLEVIKMIPIPDIGHPFSSVLEVLSKCISQVFNVGLDATSVQWTALSGNSSCNFESSRRGCASKKSESAFVMLMLCFSAWHLLGLSLLIFFKDSIPKHARPKKEWCLTCEFEILVLKVREGKSPLSPIGILSQIQSIGSHLGHGREEDAHEFLRYAFDTMQSVCLKEMGVNVRDPLAEETTLIGLIFGGYLRSKIKCMKCQGKSERHERMMNLTVEIQGDIGTLEEALTRFTATEILDRENKYQCSRCQSYEKAKKKLTVLEAPNVLTIALERFQSVRFPEILDLVPYMSRTSDKSPIYKLYAVVVHVDILNAAFSGHYICYVKNIHGKWFKVDDSTVKPVELERVLSKGANMLLYARCSLRAPSLIRNTMMSLDGKIKKRYSMAPRRSEDYPYWMTLDDPASFGSSDLDDRRDSTSTEESSDYIFSVASQCWNSPWRISMDSDASSSPTLLRPLPLAVSDKHASGSSGTSGYQNYNADSAAKYSGVRPRLLQGRSRRGFGREGKPSLFVF
ncbi:hypothetical protein HHK36_009577 [Tetracentron sinense]|uniref:USP domain-containing protein n=1 Tax=Tetracentron sinense TaxID=13715 RepID=A0A835DLR4_TETSI|nr:hypothetical protein HHK36_009577 [Tetracentron sinense]